VSIEPGQALLQYRIVDKLGEGGMGAVYRATDQTLQRDVAIKVLPDDLARDEERLARFRREATTLAALSHPNIAQIHSLEQSEGQTFLVMELAAGRDLQARLQDGAVDVRETVAIARQIAAGLEDAHEKGIVHRDLKPANVMVGDDGKVKLLDFGLARAYADEPAPEGSISASPTITAAMTQAGTILGTAAYMSPEQARGKPVDRRADIWSFGVILYEMLTGRRLFRGETIGDVLAEVLKTEPDLDALPDDAPVALRWLIARCLTRQPAERLRDIGEARVLLASDPDRHLSASLTSVPTGVLASKQSERKRERRLWIAVIALIAGLAGALAFVHWTETPPAPQPVRMVLEPPDGWRFVEQSPVPSPDGRVVAFVAEPIQDPDEPMVWLRGLDAAEPRSLEGTRGVAGSPFWSPDGQSLAFFTDRELRRIRLSDEKAQTICSIEGTNYGGSWNEAGTILFSSGYFSGVTDLYTVPASGGRATPLIDEPDVDAVRVGPRFDAGGRQFIYFEWNRSGERPSGVYRTALDRPLESELLREGFVKLSSAAGHTFFVQDGALYVGRDGADDQDLTVIASDVSTVTQLPGVGHFDVSTETIAFLVGSSLGPTQLAWVDRNGKLIEKIGKPDEYQQLTLSADEKRVAVEITGGRDRWDIWQIELARGVARVVSTSEDPDRDPVWSPDGKAIAYSTLTADGRRLHSRGTRANEPELPLTSMPEGVPEHWLRDGRLLVMFLREGVWAITTDASAEPELILESDHQIDEPHPSPDERWLAYVSDESGMHEVYVQPFRRPGDTIRISVDGGGQPLWRGDGRELYYVGSRGRLMAVRFDATEESAEVSLPEELFELQVSTSPVVDDYAPAGDGERFLVKVPLVEKKVRLHVLTGWSGLVE
jgi:serine/threonine protein kinase/Tol biopolymer transport system component